MGKMETTRNARMNFFVMEKRTIYSTNPRTCVTALVLATVHG
jgi:hypothetical protein